MENHYLNTQYTIIHLKIINKVINNMYICIGIYIFKFEPSALFHLSRAHQTFVSPSRVLQRSPTDIYGLSAHLYIHCGSSLRNVLKPELTGLRRPKSPVYEVNYEISGCQRYFIFLPGHRRLAILDTFNCTALQLWKTFTGDQLHIGNYKI